MRASPVALAVAIIVLAVGCGGASKSPPPPRHAGTASSVESCVKPGAATHVVQVAALHGPIVTIGSGSTAAVMANQDGGNLCEWLPLARGLARAGMRAAVFDYVGGASDDDVLTVARDLRRRGAHRVVLIGASTGGRVVLHAAADHPAQADGVVTLSAERTGRSGYPTLSDARRLHAPALYVGTKEDGYTTFAAETRQLYRATRAGGKQLLLLSGSEHGTDILAGTQAARVIAAITRFVQGAG